MKKYAFFAAAVAALMTCACSVDPVDIQETLPEEELTVLTAGFPGFDDETRTVRQADGKVFWSPGDAISVIRDKGESGERFVSDITEPTPTADFTGKMPSGNGPFWAIYPYNENNHYNSLLDVMEVSIPSRQEAVAGSFAKDAFISVAYVDDGSTSLTFHHACGGLKFSVTQPGVEQVIMYSAYKAILAGQVGITMPEGHPYTSTDVDGSEYIELCAPEGKTLEVGAAYHLVLPTKYLMGGFTLVFKKSDGSVAVRTVNQGVFIRPGHFLTMMDVDKNLPYESFFEYSPSQASVDAVGGMFMIHVHSSGDYHVDTSNCDWIGEVKTVGCAASPEGADIHLSALPNSGPERSGIVVICSDVTGNCFPVVVSQGNGEGKKTIKHHSLGMLFTATWCKYCPSMDEAFRLAKASLGDQFEDISLFDPAGNYGLEATNTLGDLFMLPGFPAGFIDGRVEVTNLDPSFFEAAVSETEMYYPAVTAIALSSSVSGRTVTVDADVFANVDDEYKITVFLLENNVIGRQASVSGTIVDYRHDRVARVLMTGSATGDEFSLDAGETMSFTFVTTVPSSCNVSNMEVLAYVQRKFGSRPVLQSGEYGDWYVDNCRSAALGATAALEVQ